MTADAAPREKTGIPRNPGRHELGLSAKLLFPDREIVSRLPDKSLVRHTYAQYRQRTRALASALVKLGPS